MAHQQLNAAPLLLPGYAFRGRTSVVVICVHNMFWQLYATYTNGVMINVDDYVFFFFFFYVNATVILSDLLLCSMCCM